MSAVVFEENLKWRTKIPTRLTQSVSGEVKKVILTSILLAHTRIFTRLISILMRSRLTHTFFGSNCVLWVPDYAAKLLKNA